MPDRDPDREPERGDFDRIVEGLHLDLEFPTEPADPVEPAPDRLPQAGELRWEPEDDPEPEQEAFYRQVDRTPVVPRTRGSLLAWAGVVGGPAVVVLATLAGVILPRPMLAAAVITFVAGAIYLFSQLPEHGPGRRDWPDDGAVL